MFQPQGCFRKSFIIMDKIYYPEYATICFDSDIIFLIRTINNKEQ